VTVQRVQLLQQREPTHIRRQEDHGCGDVRQERHEGRVAVHHMHGHGGLSQHRGIAHEIIRPIQGQIDDQELAWTCRRGGVE